MTAEPDLLPLPDKWTAYACMTHGEMMDLLHAYARANVAHAIAPLQAEIEALRAEVEKWRSTAVFGACGLSDHLTAMEERATAAEARAERLAEALRDMLDEYGQLHAKFDLGECQATMNARAALEQEEGRG